MAEVHHTTMVPSKIGLLRDWLPSQPWYRPTGRPPRLTRGNGFRLNDPAGEVGIEFVFVTDTTDDDHDHPTVYNVPLTYRGAPAADLSAALVGTSEHGVLGQRWIYDGARDPTCVTQLLELLAGTTTAQHQLISDTDDRSVTREARLPGRLAVSEPLTVCDLETGRTVIDVAVTAETAHHCSLELVRVLSPTTPEPIRRWIGRVDADWQQPDGATVRGPVALIR